MSRKVRAGSLEDPSVSLRGGPFRGKGRSYPKKIGEVSN